MELEELKQTDWNSSQITLYRINEIIMRFHKALAAQEYEQCLNEMDLYFTEIMPKLESYSNKKNDAHKAAIEKQLNKCYNLLTQKQNLLIIRKELLELFRSIHKGADSVGMGMKDKESSAGL